MALIHDLIEFFSTFTVVPIDPDEVRDQIVGYGVKDEINFIGVNLEERILRGALLHYTRPTGVYADPTVCADIYYDNNQNRRWRRVICCKELLHLLDHAGTRTATQKDCEKLIEDFVAIVKAKPPQYSAEQFHAWSDTLMLYYAIAVLFPIEVRSELFEPFSAGAVSLSQIAEKVDLPEDLVVLVMNPAWPATFDAILGRK
jgi:hypothetical protein